MILNQPTTPQPPPFDGKWRFFWRIGEVKGQDNLLLAPQVLPNDFPEWEQKMNDWGDIVELDDLVIWRMLHCSRNVSTWVRYAKGYIYF